MRNKLYWMSSAALIVGIFGSIEAGNAQESSQAQTAPNPQVAPAPASSTSTTVHRGRLEEVVVTARRRSESLQKVPVAVTAISGRDIKNEAVNNIKDLPALTPSLTISTNNSDPGSSTVSMRGQVQNDVIPAVQPSVGIYVDDVYFGQTVGTALLHTFDLSRIEVDKGPQGTLYGFNTTGGAIKLYNNLPTDHYEATLEAGTGSFSRAEGAIMANMPIAPGILDLRVVGQYNSNNGYGKDLTNGEGLDAEDTKSFRGTLKFTPNTDLEIDLHGEYSQSDNDGGIYKPLYIEPAAAAGLDAAIEQYGPSIFGIGTAAATAKGIALYQQEIGGNPYNVNYNLPNYTHTTVDGASLNIAYNVLDNLTLKSITSYRHLSDTDQLDLDGSTFGLLSAAQQNYQTQVTEEFQAVGQLLDTKLKYQTGVFYISRQANYISNSSDFLGLASLGLLTNPSYANSQYNTNSEAVYGQAEYAITPTINVTGGLRWTTESDTLGNSSYTGGTSYPSAGVVCNVPAAFNVNNACHVNESHADRNVSYTFGLDWAPFTDTLLYARTSRGFKSGGINERVSSAPGSLTTFLPEIVEDYEGGIKTTQLDGRLRINADIYHSDYSNYQASIIESDNGNLFTVVQNAKSAQINGAEFDVTALPVEDLTLHFLGAWTDPFYNNFVVNNGTGDINEAFRNFLQTPRWTVGVTGSYLIPSDFVNTRLTLDFSYRGDADLQPNDAPGVGGLGTPGTPDAYRIQKAYSVLNAELLFHLNKYNADILVYGKNITNTHYLEGELGLVSAGVGIATGLPGEPANWGITLTKYFR